MRRLISISVLSLTVAFLSACSRENPRMSYKNQLDEERSRSNQEVVQLRDRLAGQSQR